MRQKRTIPRTCLHCGADFRARGADVNAGNARYCSQSCSSRRTPLPPIMSADGLTARLVLCRRDGTIAGHVTVDADDLPAVGLYRWYLQPTGYASRFQGQPDGSRENLLLHRCLLGLQKGDPRNGDHINRDKLDCRRSNLRIVPDGVNSQNVNGYPAASSIHRGVYWNQERRKWIAQINVNNKNRYIGSFITENEAAEAARSARQTFMPYAVD